MFANNKKKNAQNTLYEQKKKKRIHYSISYMFSNKNLQR